MDLTGVTVVLIIAFFAGALAVLLEFAKTSLSVLPNGLVSGSKCAENPALGRLDLVRVSLLLGIIDAAIFLLLLLPFEVELPVAVLPANGLLKSQRAW